MAKLIYSTLASLDGYIEDSTGAFQWAAPDEQVFAFINDPEGPNLLVVTVMAAVIYLMSSAAYVSNFFPPLTEFKRTSATIVIEICIATALYFVLR